MAKTNAVLEVPPVVYAAIKALLVHAGLPHGDGGDVLDLRGIGLKSRGGSPNSDIVVGSLLSAATKEGRVELGLNGELTQMDLPKAREVVGMLQQAIEAAASDQMIYVFLTTRIGLDNEKASLVLLDFREIRQGSRGVVHPF